MNLWALLRWRYAGSASQADSNAIRRTRRGDLLVVMSHFTWKIWAKFASFLQSNPGCLSISSRSVRARRLPKRESVNCRSNRTFGPQIFPRKLGFDPKWGGRSVDFVDKPPQASPRERSPRPAAEMDLLLRAGVVATESPRATEPPGRPGSGPHFSIQSALVMATDDAGVDDPAAGGDLGEADEVGDGSRRGGGHRLQVVGGEHPLESAGDGAAVAVGDHHPPVQGHGEEQFGRGGEPAAPVGQLERA